MSSNNENSIRPILSSTRILFGLLPGLGAMIVIRMAIHIYRPDIEDAENRVRPVEQVLSCYDFIIVGAGSAGSVIASRLSENPNWNVLLLEAGQDENVLSEVPALFPVLQTSSIDWKFVTEPSDEYCLSMVDKQCKWPRGKALGGSSVINAMLYIRGNKRDYDYWASLGNPGWGYKDILPYFLKSEDMRIPEYQNDYYHSTGGPLTVENFRYEQPITKTILEAAQQLGYNIVDVNGETQTGFTRSHATVRDGLRCSTAKAFLRPAAKRDNLHVSVHSLVEKVLIDEHKRAYGVQYSKNGKTYIVKAGKEVILSAGAIQSPQLLMLSGIGEAEHLKELAIHPIVNLPGVGQNLQDHVAMGGHSYLFDNPYENGTDFCFNLNTVMSLGSLIDFVVNKKGSLYSMMEAEAMAFVNTKYQDPAEDYPDIQLFIAPTADNLDGGLFGKRANGLTDETYAELYEDILFDPSFSIVPLLLRPKSRGYLKLKDASPNSPPKIYPNYFSDPDDVKVMNEGARIVQSLVEQPALQQLKARPNQHRNPGCSQHELMSDEHLECQARHHTLTIYHPVGTCAMGPVNEPNAVVDPRLRVYGIKNLRVVDGSIMPTIVSGNTNTPIIMIAEKASDMIKEDWNDTEFETSCPQYTAQYKNTDNDEPSKIQLPLTQLDIFNETASLFTYLPLDDIHKTLTKTDNTEENGLALVPKKKDTERALTQKYPPKNPYPTSRSPVQESLPQYYPPYPYPQLPTYYLDPYPYKPKLSKLAPKYRPMKPTFTIPNRNYPQSRILSSLIKPNPYKGFNYFNHKKQYGSILNQFSPSYDYTVDIEEPPVFYETQEVLSPSGDKQCKIWVHYNGRKHELKLY